MQRQRAGEHSIYERNRRNSMKKGGALWKYSIFARLARLVIKPVDCCRDYQYYGMIRKWSHTRDLHLASYAVGKKLGSQGFRTRVSAWGWC